MKSLHCAESILSSAESNALKYQTLSQIIGDCHHRLASLYHKNAFDTSVVSHFYCLFIHVLCSHCLRR